MQDPRNEKGAKMGAGAERAEQKRPCILFFAEAVTLAHVARPVVLAQALASADSYDIHLACDTRYKKIIDDTAFEVHAIWSIPSHEFLKAMTTGSPQYDAKTLHAYVQEDLAVLEAVQPDIVVGDFRLSLAVSTRLAGVPYVAISNAYWSPFARQCYPVPEHPLIGRLGIRFTQRLFNVIRPVVFAHHARPLNSVRRKYGLPSLGHDLRRTYTDADYLLYADVPELIPTFDPPASHRYIGSILWSPKVEVPAWWHLQIERRSPPIVYVTLGSSGDYTLLPLLLEALAVQPVRVFLATAGRAALDDLPENVFAAEFLPGLEASSHACLVICNGGSPTTSQALAFGVPVLGIPSNLDQYLNMEYIRQTGVGEYLRADSLTADLVTQRITEMITDPRYKELATRFAEAASRYDAAYRFREFIQEVMPVK
jgi:UDP:flavonoid glycosyltransferase YjiC (YdhE family)